LYTRAGACVHPHTIHQTNARARTHTRNRYVSCGGGGGGGGGGDRDKRSGRIRSRQSGGRHGSRRTGFGRGRALEAHTTEHVHAMGQRAPKDGRQGHRKSGNGPGRRAPVDRPHRGAQRQAVAQAQ